MLFNKLNNKQKNLFVFVEADKSVLSEAFPVCLCTHCSEKNHNLDQQEVNVCACGLLLVVGIFLPTTFFKNLLSILLM